MSNFDGWLDRMLGTAMGVGAEKRGMFYTDKEKERRNKELIQQMSEAGATQRTGITVKSASDVANISRQSSAEVQEMRNKGAIDTQKLQNQGSLATQGLQNTGTVNLAQIQAAERRYAVDREAAYKEKEFALGEKRLQPAFNEAARTERVNQIAKSQDISINRSESKALLNAMEKSLQAQQIQDTAGAFKWFGGKTPNQIEESGLKKEDILSPEAWKVAMGELNKRKKSRQLLNAY